MGDDAGPILLRSGLIDSEQLRTARQAASGGGELVEHLVNAGSIDDDELTGFFHRQLLVPVVDQKLLRNIQPRIIKLIPGDMAIECRAIPVSLDREGNLTVVFSDPSNVTSVDEITFFTGKYLIRAIATQRQIAWCLANYYGHITVLGQTLLRPHGASPGNSPGDGVPLVITEYALQNRDKPRPKSVTSEVEALRKSVRPPITSPLTSPPTDEPADDDDSSDDRSAASPSESGDVAPEPPTIHPRDLERQGSAAGTITRARKKPLSGRISHQTSGELNTDESGRVSSRTSGEVSGEIAAADSNPYDSYEDDTTVTGPMKTIPLNHLVEEEAYGPPPELAPRAGELKVETGPVQRPLGEFYSLPKVVIDEPAAPTEENTDAESVPIVLDTPSKKEVSEVFVLDQIKEKHERKRTHTQVGVGALGVPSGQALPPSDAIPIVDPDAPDSDAHAQDSDAHAPDSDAHTPDSDAHAPDSDAHVQDSGAIPEPAPDSQQVTGRFSRVPKAADIDDGWGPPGSTIPPFYLGAMPESSLARDASTSTTAPQSDASASSKHKTAVPDPDSLEQSSVRVVQTIRSLDQADSRDSIIECLLNHLSAEYEQAAFFAVKSEQLRWFQGASCDKGDSRKETLSLAEPSTFHDAVRARLPFRGRLADAISRDFVIKVLGTDPEQVLVFPLAVRNRVVGVLCGNSPKKPISDEQLVLITSAGGMALERILRNSKKK